jgi:hypothetical protein
VPGNTDLYFSEDEGARALGNFKIKDISLHTHRTKFKFVRKTEKPSIFKNRYSGNR